MNSRLYYKYLSSRIASKWIVLLIDLLIVLVSMLLAFIIQWEISSITYNTSLYSWMSVLTVLCCALFFSDFPYLCWYYPLFFIYRYLSCVYMSYFEFWIIRIRKLLLVAFWFGKYTSGKYTFYGIYFYFFFYVMFTYFHKDFLRNHSF